MNGTLPFWGVKFLDRQETRSEIESLRLAIGVINGPFLVVAKPLLLSYVILDETNIVVL
jgi:hypothetical protein